LETLAEAIAPKRQPLSQKKTKESKSTNASPKKPNPAKSPTPVIVDDEAVPGWLHMVPLVEAANCVKAKDGGYIAISGRKKDSFRCWRYYLQTIFIEGPDSRYAYRAEGQKLEYTEWVSDQLPDRSSDEAIARFKGLGWQVLPILHSIHGLDGPIFFRQVKVRKKALRSPITGSKI
jgi:hypothetical protein